MRLIIFYIINRLLESSCHNEYLFNFNCFLVEPVVHGDLNPDWNVVTADPAIFLHLILKYITGLVICRLWISITLKAVKVLKSNVDAVLGIHD